MRSKYEARVRMLLAKAASTDSEHEAQALTEKAEQLMVQWGISDLSLDDPRVAADFETIELDYAEVRTVYLRSYLAKLFGHCVAHGLLGDQVRCAVGTDRDWLTGKIQHRLIVVGRAGDLVRFRLLHDSLLAQLQHAMQAWVRRQQDNPWGRWGSLTPSQKKRERIQFAASFGQTIYVRLSTIRETEHGTRRDLDGVLVRRSDEVDAKFNEMFPEVKKSAGVKGGSRFAADAGIQAGTDAHFGASLASRTQGALR